MQSSLESSNSSPEELSTRAGGGGGGFGAPAFRGGCGSDRPERRLGGGGGGATAATPAEAARLEPVFLRGGGGRAGGVKLSGRRSPSNCPSAAVSCLRFKGATSLPPWTPPLLVRRPRDLADFAAASDTRGLRTRRLPVLLAVLVLRRDGAGGAPGPARSNGRQRGDTSVSERRGGGGGGRSASSPESVSSSELKAGGGSAYPTRGCGFGIGLLADEDGGFGAGVGGDEEEPTDEPLSCRLGLLGTRG